MLLDLGVVGLGLMLVVVVELIIRASGVSGLGDARRYGQWGLLFVVSLLMMALAEPLLTGPYLSMVAIALVVLTGLEQEHQPGTRLPSATTF